MRKAVDYREYITSDAWRLKRAEALNRAGHKCQLCSSTRDLNVHHNTYDNLGDERETDLLVLCKRCHDTFHARCDPRTKKKMKRVKVKPSRLPAPPVPVHVRPAKVAKPSKYANGRMMTVVIDEKYLRQLITGPAGITAVGISLLGETWPPQAGWRSRVIGKVVTVDQGELQHERDRCASKCADIDAKTRQLSDQEKLEIYEQWDHQEQKNYAPMMAKYGVSKGVIRSALKDVLAITGRRLCQFKNPKRRMRIAS